MVSTSHSIIVVRCLLSLAAGMVFPLGFSPFNYWPISMLAIGIIFLLIRMLSIKTATISGILFSIGMFGTGTSWVYVSINEFGQASFLLSGLLSGIFVLCVSVVMGAPLFSLYSWLNHRKLLQGNKKVALLPIHQAMMFSGLWVIFEWIRSWLLTGFPWLLSGYTLLDTVFSSFAPITGVYGLSLLMVTTSCIIFALVIPEKKSGKNKFIPLIVVGGIWLIAFPANYLKWTEKTGKISFSAIQGNIPQNVKWDPDHINTIINTYTGLSEQQWGRELVIWPENAIPLFYNRARGLINSLDKLARQNSSALILGIPVDDNSGDRTRYYNSVLSIGEGYLPSEGFGRYDKQKLVPFGEYVPLESVLRGLIQFFDLPMSNFSKGVSEQPLIKFGTTKIAPFICYEIVYPDFVAKTVHDSGLIINISNDTWFGKSIGPIQHFQITRMRALETGRYIVRATNDGITALIDDKGKVVETIPRFTKGVLSSDAEIRKGYTPFMILGSWPTLLICFLMLFSGLTRLNLSRNFQ